METITYSVCYVIGIKQKDFSIKHNLWHGIVEATNEEESLNLALQSIGKLDKDSFIIMKSSIIVDDGNENI